MHKFLKIISLIISFIFFCGVVVQPVYASFSDDESSTGNTFSATTLNFSLRDAGDVILTSPYFNISDIKPGDSQTKYFRIKKEGFLDFKYQLSAVQTGGDAGLCTALQVEAKLGSVVQYNGGLLGLTLSSLPTISGGQDDWTYTISLTDGSSALQNKTCQFDFKINAWQTDSDGTWGFGDEETLSNSVASGTWTLSNAVVINEIMWMGSTASTADEWIELRNTTANPIVLAGWKIENAGESGASITLAGTIPANGFFLLSNYATSASAINDSIPADQVTTDVSLLDSGEQLTLRNNTSTVIDQTPSGSWPQGMNGPTDWKSMERNDTPSDGTVSTNWHTCVDAACHSTTYWDADGHNWGTPKAANLSENDLSSPAYVAPTVTPTPTPTPTATPELNSELLASPPATIVEPIPTASQTPLPEVIITPTPTPEPSATPSPQIIFPEEIIP